MKSLFFSNLVSRPVIDHFVINMNMNWNRIIVRILSIRTIIRLATIDIFQLEISVSVILKSQIRNLLLALRIYSLSFASKFLTTYQRNRG